jgi:beta-xylosidase
VRQFTNPVHPTYFADPFVLRHEGVYYAYGTIPVAGRTVPALRSRDLVEWESIGDVLEPLERAGHVYWAPEVARGDDGRFYLYFSVGQEEGEGHRLRVAVADAPEGPFVDSGRVLDSDPFSIDAHPFRDDDGSWYLFFCRDFLEGERVGTGIVVDRLVTMTELAGDVRTAIRPFADWHLYEAQRHWYGRTWDWYTVEGPFVRKMDGRYHCFFSGGAWREPSYGVSYAVAEHPLGPWEVVAEEPAILRTVPGKVLGPGHASIVASPSGRSDVIVYHGWDPDATARLMRIDLLEWTPEGPRCDGPSVDPRPVPD